MHEKTTKQNFQELQERIIQSRLCPRLVESREQIAREKRRAFRDWTYWGKPVPALGSADARLLIVGLAPAAHGANRTGRMFTGDQSGDFLYATLYRFGFCNQPTSRHRQDGLKMQDAVITAAVRCAPPGNRPTPAELRNCRQYLAEEVGLMQRIRAVVVLGRIAFQAFLTVRKELGLPIPFPRPVFGHAHRYDLDEKTTLICSYHPSRQNTQTGRLTQEMFDEVFRLAREILDG